MRYAAILPVMLAAACEPSSRPIDAHSRAAQPISDVRVEPQVELEALAEQHGDDFLVVSLTALNPDSDTTELSTGRCPIRVRAFSSPDLVEPAFWDDHSADSLSVCYADGWTYLLPPGRSDLWTDTLFPSGLAMGLPEESGHFGVITIRNGRRVVLPAGPTSPR